MPDEPQLCRHVILAAWVAWAIFWLVSARNTKATQQRESRGSRLAHVVPLLLGGLLIGIHWGPWIPLLGLPLWPRSFLALHLGVALLIAGLGFAIWARVHLGRNWSGTVTVKEGHELIRTGPYAYVRHPIYTGILTAVIGTAICSGTLRAALGFLIIVFAVMRKLRIEEEFMRQAFPDQYAKYCDEVPALVPFTKSRSR